MIGETVDVLDRLRVDRLLGCEPRNAALGTARDGAREMQSSRNLAAARQDERGERREFGVHGVDLFFKSFDLARHDAQGALATLALALGRAEIGAEIEQVILDAAQHGVGLSLIHI